MKDYFEVERDKSQLAANDDIFDFMAEIANCDNVVIVLTSDYVKSVNCMREVAYLLQQPDWTEKVMVLVIDESIYGTDRKIEILNYWDLRMKYVDGQFESAEVGKIIIVDDVQNIREIICQIEGFLAGISRMKNPSQIAIVNELVRRKGKKNTLNINNKIQKGEEYVLAFIKQNETATLSDIAAATSMSKAYASRVIHKMIEENIIKVVCTNRNKRYVVN